MKDDDAAIPMQRRIWHRHRRLRWRRVGPPSHGGECIREHASVIRSAIVDEVQSADVVLIAAGLGGGTGSAVEALLSIPKKTSSPSSSRDLAERCGERAHKGERGACDVSDLEAHTLRHHRRRQRTPRQALHPTSRSRPYFAHQWRSSDRSTINQMNTP